MEKKLFSELTEQELAALTAKDIEYYKNLMLAQKGIQIPIAPIKKTYDVEKPDILVYEVSIPSYIAFANIEDAKTLINCIKTLKSRGTCDYDSGCGYDNKYFKKGINLDYNGEEGEIYIKSRKAYSSEKYAQLKESLIKKNKEEDKYQDELAAYNTLLDKAKGICSVVDIAIRNAKENIERKITLCDIFYSKYYPLTEDIDTAMQYFKLAYNVTDEQEEYIRKNNGKINATAVCS